MTTQTIEPRMELEQHLHMYRQMAKIRAFEEQVNELYKGCLLYTSPSPRDISGSRMPSSA